MKETVRDTGGASRRERLAKEKDREHREDELDDALAETFPASDPPSMTDPTVARKPSSKRRSTRHQG